MGTKEKIPPRLSPGRWRGTVDVGHAAPGLSGGSGGQADAAARCAGIGRRGHRLVCSGAVAARSRRSRGVGGAILVGISVVFSETAFIFGARPVLLTHSIQGL